MAPRDTIEGLAERIEDIHDQVEGYGGRIDQLGTRIGAVEVSVAGLKGLIEGMSSSLETIKSVVAPPSEKAVLAGLDYRKAVLLGTMETIQVFLKNPSGWILSLVLLCLAIPTGLFMKYSLVDGLTVGAAAEASENGEVEHPAGAANSSTEDGASEAPDSPPADIPAPTPVPGGPGQEP